MINTWTKPFYGVTHYQTCEKFRGPGWLATVIDCPNEWQNFAEVHIMRLPLASFTPTYERTYFAGDRPADVDATDNRIYTGPADYLQAAKSWAEQKAKGV